MSLATIYADIQAVAAEVGPIITAIGGKSGSSAAAPAKTGVGVTLGIDPLPELTAALGVGEAALNTITGVAKMFAQWDAEMNTPEMVNASVAQKLQAFKDRVNNDLATGNEADLEKLESQ
jgi:hypothetical protein